MSDVIDINVIRNKKKEDMALNAVESIMFALSDYITQKVRLMYFTVTLDSLETAVLYDNNMDEVDLKLSNYCLKIIASSMDKYIDKIGTKEFIVEMDALIVEMILSKMNDVEKILESDELI